MNALIDPRRGDVEDDASSTKRRSLLAIAGKLLTEISLPKLFAAWVLLVALPGLLLGLAPLVVSAWLATLTRTIATSLTGIGPLVMLAFVAILGWLGGRPLFRIVEKGFWSLNSIAVQPGYALCREVLRHVVERQLSPLTGERQARVRAASALCSGLIVCAMALAVVFLVWPWTRWTGQAADLAAPHRLVMPALANAVLLLSGYLALAALLWGLADATMDQPMDLQAFDGAPSGGRRWRVVHLSDVHIVGERYGFRIESGRSGPCGNDRMARLLRQLDVMHAEHPIDVVLITGDITDAGRSTEWAEFLSMLEPHTELSKRILILPGNHDLNIVDRANPARLDLPTSPGKRLRQMRALSAMASVQGDRVRVFDHATDRLGDTLSVVLASHRHRIETFADTGALRLSFGLDQLWASAFPMVLPPDGPDGLGVILLNSNAEAHFSFTNALGLVSVEQANALGAIARQFPRAHWLIALHHHLVEYPKPPAALSERIGTALINGTWFVRELRSLGGKAVVMHGHRHIDWIGKCGDVRIVSAPSPIMEATNDEPTCAYVHNLATAADGRLYLLTPERIEIAGETVN